MSETQTFKPNYEEYNPASYNKEIYGEIPSIEAERTPTSEREVALEALRSLVRDRAVDIPTQRTSPDAESVPNSPEPESVPAISSRNEAWDIIKRTRDRQVRP